MLDSIEQRLKQRKAQLHKEMAAAATSGDSPTLLRLGDELRGVESVATKFRSLVDEAEAVISGPASHGKPDTPPDVDVGTRSRRVHGRGQGVEIRTAFLQDAASRGIQLTPHRGSIFTTVTGRKVGLAVATERQRDRWFLGLPANSVDSAVLLCQTNGGKRLDVCLPGRFFQRYGAQLSNSGGQWKFNVHRRAGRIVLNIPGHSSFDATDLVGEVSEL